MARDIAFEHMENCIRLGARTEPHGFISTGHFDLDYAIVNGNLPGNVNLDKLDYDPKLLGLRRGISIEIYGDEGSGKSSLGYRACGIAQKQGLKCLWNDTEFSFSEDLARINGVDTDQLYMMDADSFKDVEGGMTGERIFDRTYEALIHKGINVVVFDSVAGLVPQQVMDKSTEEETMAALARLMSKALPKFMQLIAKYNATAIFLNQIREKPGVMYGDPTTTPGGRALKFYSSIRLDMRKRTSDDSMIYMEDDDGVQQLIAQTARIRIRKNRFAKYMKDPIDVPVYFQPYFPRPEETAFSLGRQLKIISVREGVFKWGDVRCEGKTSFLAMLKSLGTTTVLIDEIKAKAKAEGVVLPPEVMNYEIVEDGLIKTKEDVATTVTSNVDANEIKVQRGRKKKDSGLVTENTLE